MRSSLRSIASTVGLRHLFLLQTKSTLGRRDSNTTSSARMIPDLHSREPSNLHALCPLAVTV